MSGPVLVTRFGVPVGTAATPADFVSGGGASTPIVEEPSVVVTGRVSADIEATRLRAEEAARIREAARVAGISAQVQLTRQRASTRRQIAEEETRERRLQTESVGGRTLRTGERQFFFRGGQTPRPTPTTRRQRIERAVSRVVSPLGSDVISLPSGTLVRRQDLTERELRQATLIRGLPLGSETFGFAVRRPTIPKVRGEARIRPRQQEGLFDVELITGAREPLGDRTAITISKQIAKDIRTGTVGGGRAFTITPRRGGVEITRSELIGVTRRIGRARLVTETPKGVRISRPAGRGVISDVAFRDIARIRLRRGIRVGVRRGDVLPVDTRITRGQITGFLRPSGGGRTIRFTGSPRAVTRISRRGITRRIRSPDISLEIGFGKFPSEIPSGRISPVSRRRLRSRRLTTQQLGLVRQIAPDLAAQALKTSQTVERIATRSIRPAAPSIRGLRPRVSVRTDTIPRAIQKPITITRVRAVQRSRVASPTINKQLDKQVSRLAQSQAQGQRQRQRQRLRQQQSVSEISRQRLRQRERQALGQRQLSLRRLRGRTTIPTLSLGIARGILIPVVPFVRRFQPIKTPRLSTTRKATDDLGISETFTQRQLLLPLPLGLRRKRRKRRR